MTDRKQAYLKTEAYGFTIRDATKAIELNPGFVKVRNAPIDLRRIRGAGLTVL